MSVLFKGNLEEGNYTLIKSTDGWVLKGETSYVGFNFADRPQGEWKSVKASIYPYGYDVECSVCGHRMGSSFGYKFCPMCGCRMKGADDESVDSN